MGHAATIFARRRGQADSQEQERQDRMAQLRLLLNADVELLCCIACGLAEELPGLPRQVCRELLGSPEVAQLLELKAAYPAQVCMTVRMWTCVCVYSCVEEEGLLAVASNHQVDGFAGGCIQQFDFRDEFELASMLHVAVAMQHRECRRGARF